MPTLRAWMRRWGIGGTSPWPFAQGTFVETAAGGQPGVDDAFMRLEMRLRTELAPLPPAARKRLPHTHALQAALAARRRDGHPGTSPPAAPRVILEAMHECWTRVDDETRQLFKQCLLAASRDGSWSGTQ